MKKRFALLLALALLLVAVFPVGAEEISEPTEAAVRAENQCGEDLYWSYADGMLTITGTGSMDDYEDGAPWSEYQNEMTQVLLAGDVTYIGAHAFQNFDALTQVDFGDALYEIGMEAFSSCDGLTVIYLPASFKIFGESCFQSCQNLTEIHCEGVFPSFRQNCLWDTYATIYFPAERPWSVDLIQELEEAFSGRIEFLASDGSDPYDPTAETESDEEETTPETDPEASETQAAETTPATTAETTPETTQAPTEASEAATVPAETESQEEESGGANGLVIGSLIVCFVLILAVAGALIFRRHSGGGKYSR